MTSTGPAFVLRDEAPMSTLEHWAAKAGRAAPRQPFQFSLASLFGLTTRAAIATAIATTLGSFLLAIMPQVFFAWVWLTLLVGVLVLPYVLWLALQRLVDGVRTLSRSIRRR
jgi:hypothetical protein